MASFYTFAESFIASSDRTTYPHQFRLRKSRQFDWRRQSNDRKVNEQNFIIRFVQRLLKMAMLTKLLANSVLRMRFRGFL